MKETLALKYMKLLEPLSVEVKLELLSKLSESLKKHFRPDDEQKKEAILDELTGSWSDVNFSAEDVVLSRTIQKREVNLD